MLINTTWSVRSCSSSNLMPIFCLLVLFCIYFLCRELREDLPSPSAFQCFLPQPTVVTTVHLRRASGLSSPKQTGCSVQVLSLHLLHWDSYTDRRGQKKQEKHLDTYFNVSFFGTLISSYGILCCVLWSTAPDVYAVVRCENDTIRTRVFKAEGNPEFNLRTIFYRRYPNAHISIEVWHIHIPSHTDRHTHIHSHNLNLPVVICCVQLWSRGLLLDSVLGGARLLTAESERGRSHEIDLRGGQSGSGFRGCVYVETSSSICLTDL